ncbi:hypothetical protein P22_3538 [Propionispora sp. 2/2-37]|uniref:helix-turn-helix domain-containing protein n=1 Tax=Propionispora sp. 2/2-37 TaxID=1677858 RepID=UPI0006BB8902|nr:helix-turn-helix transcriptional regulator [Propionispora sp. 2/2-37]CUH97409.1 hypothetical protein P22_3538 [Propionispora sp. 2/2-37]
MNVWDKIRSIRMSKDITQEEMAKVLEVTQASYARYEKNKPDISIEGIEKIALKLGVDKMELLEEEPSLNHHPKEIIEWLEKIESKSYILNAYIQYLKDKS